MDNFYFYVFKLGNVVWHFHLIEIDARGRKTSLSIKVPTLQKQTFLVAQLIKNPPAMQETLVRFLGWEDPLEKGYATHSSVLGLPW